MAVEWGKCKPLLRNGKELQESANPLSVYTIPTCHFIYHCKKVDAGDVLEKSIWLTFFIQEPFVILSLPNHTLSLPRRIHQFPQIGHGGIINVNIGMCLSKRAYKYLNNLCSFFSSFLLSLNQRNQQLCSYNVNRTIRRIKRSREKSQQKIWPSIF